MSRPKLRKYEAIIVVRMHVKSEGEAQEIAAAAAKAASKAPGAATAHVDALEEVDDQAF